MLGIEVRLLGRPNVIIDGLAAAMTGRPLLLVLRLALSADGPVPVSRLQHDLWPDGSGSEGAVRVTLTRARKVLGDAALVRRHGGYALAGVEVDALRFERAVRAARDRAVPLERRIASYDAALREWTGPAADGLDGFAWLDAEMQRLDELREQAVDERFELVLLSGDHEREVADMRTALVRCPTREHRAALLVIALYRSGRQVEALAVLNGVRNDLRDRLGLEPGPSLRELERQVLQHEPGLMTSPLVQRVVSATDVEAQLRAVTALLRAGIVDETRLILDEAERVAVEAGDRRSLGLVYLSRARLMMLTGEADPHSVIDEARHLGRELRDGDLLAQAALVRFGAGVPADKSAALIELLEPLSLLSPTAPEQVDLLCAAAVVTSFIDASRAAEQLVAQAEKVCEQNPSPRARAVLLVARSLVTSVSAADPDHADAQAEEAYQLATATGDATLVTVAAQGMLRSNYERGDLRAVDAVVATLEDAARAAMLPFGAVRVSLCRATNAVARAELRVAPVHLEQARVDGERMRTFAIAGAVRVQQTLLLLEADERDLVLAGARLGAATRGGVPGTWDAVAALCGDDDVAARLASLAPQVPVDDTHQAFAAVAAEVAARRCDAELGRWCAARLDAVGERTVMIGLGTAVIGFGLHFAGMAHAAAGDLVASTDRLERAVQRAADAGAWLWCAHSRVELADVLARAGDIWAAKEQLNELEASGIAGRSARVARRTREVAALLSV